MKTKNKTWNKKIFILLFIIGINITLICASNLPIYYRLSIDYDNGKINVKDIGMQVSQIDISDNFGENVFEIIDFNGNTISSNNFAIPNKIIYDYGNESGELTSGKTEILNTVSFDMFIPYYVNAKEIRLYDENRTELGRADVSNYAVEKAESQKEIVGNDRDEHGCIGSAGYVWCEEKQKCLRTWKEACKTQTSGNNIPEQLTNINYIITGLIIIVIILIIIFFFYLKKKGRK